jgi:spectinomycin phosphotransferase
MSSSKYFVFHVSPFSLQGEHNHSPREESSRCVYLQDRDKLEPGETRDGSGDFLDMDLPVGSEDRKAGFVNPSVRTNYREYNQAMLERPEFPDEAIIACLRSDYQLRNPQVEFLPLGVDQNSAVYRAVDGGQGNYFVKLRHGLFNGTSVTLPRYLSDQGLHQIIAPLKTRTGMLWANLDNFAVILYPYIEGRNGYEIDLSDHHWIELGQTLQRIHSTILPEAIKSKIKRETYSPQARETVKRYLTQIEQESPVNPVGVKLTAFLKSKQHDIFDLVERAERHAQALQGNPPARVLCHSDLHAGNILIDGSDALYIVDWDEPIYAPKERDLMFPGGGQGFRGHTAGEEEALFYRGYGPASIHPTALAYYRYERIVQDIAAFCDQVFSSDDRGEDREQAFNYLTSNFKPGGTIEIAYRSDQTGASR